MSLRRVGVRIMTMLPMSEGALEVLYSSTHIAVDFGYSFYSYETMMLALMDNHSIADVLEAHGVDLAELEENLQKHMDKNYPKFDLNKIPAGIVAHVERDRFLEEAINTHKDTQDAVRKVGTLAQKIAQESEEEEVSADHFFLAILQLESIATYKMLLEYGLTFEAVHEYLQTNSAL